MLKYLALMRPKQWIKNLMVLAGPGFAHRLDLESVDDVALVFAVFCLASSSGYVINDLLDRHADALHPTKRHRPVASGVIAPWAAVLWGLTLGAVSLTVCGLLLPVGCLAVLAAYLVMVFAYSLALKRRVILDVIIIALGFVLRAAAGAEAVEVEVSPWLVVCTFTLCLFLGFGKRRCELAVFSSRDEAREHRATLVQYSAELLNHLISVSAGVAIVTFLLYTMDLDPAHAPPFHKEHLLYTIPFVVYGIFRYALLIETGTHHGPTDILLKDRASQINVIVWITVTSAIIWERQLLEALGWGHLFTHG